MTGSPADQGPATSPGGGALPRTLDLVPRLSPSLEREIGHAGVSGLTSVTGLSWVDDYEETPELQWPNSVIVFERMARTDAQSMAVLRSMLLPMMGRARYRLGRKGADPRVLQFLESELGLNVDPRDATARRRRQGIAWVDYLRSSYKPKLTVGHSVMEQVYAIGPPNPDQAAPGMPPALAHLRKLATRPARSIARWDVAADGGLDGVAQYVQQHGTYETVTLPIDRLVVHTNEKEGANWRGESVFRPSYKHWLILDQLMRLGPMVAERNGMGLPVVTYDPATGNRATALQLARAARAGVDAGMALPPGYTFSLVGVTGSLKDELPLMKWHAQQIGKNALAMVLDLGHDAGARNLGDTFQELFTLGLNTMVDEFCSVTTEHVIRDLVELNFGPDEPYPPLLADELTPEQTLMPADLKALADAGVIIPDDELEAEVRRRYNLPLWPGAAEGEPDNDVERILDVDPETPADPSPPDPADGTPVPQIAAAEAGHLLTLEHQRHVARGARYVASCRTCSPHLTDPTSGRSTDELRARLAAVDARLNARAAARG